MKRKKICFVTSVPLTVSVFLTSHICHLVHKFDIYVISHFDNLPFNDDPRVTFIRAPIKRTISPFFDLYSLFFLYKLLRSCEFDAVHSVTPKAGMLAMLTAWFCGVPIRIHWFTGQVWATKRGVYRYFLKQIDCFIGRASTQLLVDSPSQRDFLISERVVSPGRLEVIGDGSICGVDSQRFRPDISKRTQIRFSLCIPSEALVVLYLGRINEDKGLLDMANAMLLLETSCPGVHWVLVGPDEQDIGDRISCIAASFQDRLHIIGQTSVPQDYMAAADLFCLPSYREGFGSSVLEAAACGLPAVVTSIYGLVDAVEDGVTGLMVPPRCPNDLAEAIKCLLADGERRRNMGRAARKRAIEQFSQQRLVDGLDDFYTRVFGLRELDVH